MVGSEYIIFGNVEVNRWISKNFNKLFVINILLYLNTQMLYIIWYIIYRSICVKSTKGSTYSELYDKMNMKETDFYGNATTFPAFFQQYFRVQYKSMILGLKRRAVNV